MGRGVAGTAEKAPSIQAIGQRFEDGDWQQIRWHTADWILKLHP